MLWDPRNTTKLPRCLEMSIDQLPLLSAAPYPTYFQCGSGSFLGHGESGISSLTPDFRYTSKVLWTDAYRGLPEYGTLWSGECAYKRCGGICNHQIQGKTCNKVTCVTLRERFRWGIIMIILYITTIIIMHPSSLTL